MPKFRHIQRSGYLPDLIASDILSRVDSGELGANERLPPEQELADSFGVSRNVVREAIARLRSDGVVDTKPGRGAIVLPRAARATYRVDVAQLDQKDRMANLFELRALLEIDAAGLAAIRRDSGDLEVMRQAIADMSDATVFGQTQVDADIKFHLAVGIATQNDYLATIISYISGRINEISRATLEICPNDDLVEITTREHTQIVEAIQTQDTEQARFAMASHINAAANRLGIHLKLDEIDPTES